MFLVAAIHFFWGKWSLSKCTINACWKEIVVPIVIWFFIHVMVWALGSHSLPCLLQKSQDMGEHSKIHYSQEVTNIYSKTMMQKIPNVPSSFFLYICLVHIHIKMVCEDIRLVWWLKKRGMKKRSRIWSILLIKTNKLTINICP